MNNAQPIITKTLNVVLTTKVSLNRLIIQDQSHESFYKNFGHKEYIKKYN